MVHATRISPPPNDGMQTRARRWPGKGDRHVAGQVHARGDANAVWRMPAGKGAATVSCWPGLLLLAFLAGCAVDSVTPDVPFAALPDQTAGLKIGQSNRGTSRGQLGEPRWSSVYWRFDLFRADAEQSNVVLAITPWPVPFARIKDQLHRYTLVAYDAEGRVSAFATGLHRKPAAWRNVSPIQSDFPALHLRAADVLFFVDPEGARDINLLLAPAGRDAFIKQARASGNCMAVLGCGDSGCGDQLTVDAGPVRRLPLRNAHAYWFREGERADWLAGMAPHADDMRGPWLETLVAISLAAGEHSFDFSAKYLGGRHTLPFSCRAGAVSYLTINATDDGKLMNRALVNWNVVRTETMPTRFARRPLVLVDDGKWYVDAEPALPAGGGQQPSRSQ